MESSLPPVPVNLVQPDVGVWRSFVPTESGTPENLNPSATPVPVNSVQPTVGVWRASTPENLNPAATATGGPINLVQPTVGVWRSSVPAESGTSDNLNLAATATPPNPIVTPVSSPLGLTGVVYNCFSDTDIDNVPWSSLTPGSIVNIHYKQTAYKRKIGIRSSGTAAYPILINGVTDSLGNRPKFDFSGSMTSPLSANVFSGVDDESLGGIVIKPGASDSVGYIPAFIKIKNLELFGANNGTSYTSVTSGSQTFVKSAAIWIELGQDILIENCVIYNNSLGIFAKSTGDNFNQASKRLTVRSNRVYDNGIAGSSLESNIYLQCANPVVDGNYIGKVKSLALGSSYKSRASAEIFRYNYVESLYTACEWLNPINQKPGISTQSDYGIDYVYGNIIKTEPGFSGSVLHYGGDTWGEDGVSNTLVVPPEPYRSQLYFYSNSVSLTGVGITPYTASLFSLSLAGTLCTAWNNIFSFDGQATSSWLKYAGQLTLAGNNLAFNVLADADSLADPGRYSVTNAGQITTTSPAFVNALTGQLLLTQGSPAIDSGTNLPAGVSPIVLSYPVLFYPNIKLNGLNARVRQGLAHDLGAIEYILTTPVDPNPAALSVGTILTISPAEWKNELVPGNYPIQRSWQWLRDGAPILGAVGAAYTTQESDVGKSLTVKETAWFIKKDNNGSTVEIPIATAVSVSAAVQTAGTSSIKLVYQDDLAYVGSFKMPDLPPGQPGFDFGGRALTTVPGPYSANGQSTLLSLGDPAFPSAGEITIPSLSLSSDVNLLPTSGLLRPASLVDPFEGQLTFGTPQSVGLGVVDRPNISQGIRHISNTTSLLLSGSNPYSPLTFSPFWRRDYDLTKSGTVEGPFTVIDPVYQPNPKITAGFMCEIPAEHQPALGGTILAGTGGLGTVRTTSDGPSAISFDHRSVDVALTQAETGIAQGGSTDKIILSNAASSTSSYYVNFYIYVPTSSRYARKIIAYNGATKEATVEGSGLIWELGLPTSATPYRLYPYVPGTQLLAYNQGEFGNPLYPSFSPIWSWAGTQSGMCIPNGTNSLLFFGINGDGLWNYGITGENYPVGWINATRIYDPDKPSKEQLPHAYPYSTKIWAYDLTELAEVKAGTRAFNSVKPYAVFSIQLPFGSVETLGVTYDPLTRQIYIVQRLPSGETFVHAYRCDKADVVIPTGGIVPAIQTTTLNAGTTGTIYSSTLTSIGSMPITWSITSGSLPSGITLNPTTGLISGSTTISGTTSFTVRATNSIGYDEQALTLSISEGGQRPPVTLDGIQIFPVDHILNTKINQLPADVTATSYISAIMSRNPSAGLISDFTLPVNVVDTPGIATAITFTAAAESNPGPYPIPSKPLIEGGAIAPTDGSVDRRMLLVDRTTESLYEVFFAVQSSNGAWTGYSGAKWNLQSNTLRPETWTSADPSGLPITPLLVRYDEILNGSIRHALRFSLQQVKNSYVWPARDSSSSINLTNVLPFGARLRLKSNFDISGFSPANQVILLALKEYGMVLAEPGTDGAISGIPDSRWNQSDLANLSSVLLSNFEVVDTLPLQINKDSAQAKNEIPAIITPSLTPATVSVAYQANLVASVFGTASVTWTVSLGNLPTGFSLSSVNNVGIISGTTTDPGSYSFTVRATTTAGFSEKSYVLSVASSSLGIVTSALPEITGYEGISIPLEASGLFPITWSIVNGIAPDPLNTTNPYPNTYRWTGGGLPAGLALDKFAGRIIGSTSVLGQSTFTVGVSNPTGSVTKTFTLNVKNPSTGLPVIHTTLLANVRTTSYFSVDSNYNYNAGDYGSSRLWATGEAPITWAVTGGTLPPGITLRADGVLSGVATAAGDYTFTVRATNPQGSVTQQLTLKSIDGLSAVPTVRSRKIPDMCQGSYALKHNYLASIGQTSAVTWSILPNSDPFKQLPAGLKLDPVTGLISGTVTGAIGEYFFTVQAQTAEGIDQSIINTTVSVYPTGVPVKIVGPTIFTYQGNRS